MAALRQNPGGENRPNENSQAGAGYMCRHPRGGMAGSIE